MEILDLKDLEKVLKLARKAGVKTLRVGEIEFTLSESHAPVAKPRGKSAAKPTVTSKLNTRELEGEMTPEQLLFWSSNFTQELIDKAGGDQ
jgi:hypothetical protein